MATKRTTATRSRRKVKAPEPPAPPEIRNEYAYHAPTDRQIELITAARQGASTFADFIDQYSAELDPRSAAVAKTKLDELLMWFNRAVVLGSTP